MSKTKGNMTGSLEGSLLENLTGAADPIQAAAPEKKTKAQKTASVYMTNDQHAAIERIARELETNKHAVMQIAIRHFIEDYDSGKYKPEPLYRKVYF